MPKRRDAPNESFLDAALAYAAGGFHVFPVAERSKRPHECVNDGGYHRATTDTDQIRAWWNRYPTANVGIACEESGIVAVDIDGWEGKDGEAAWNRLIADHGDVPSTVAALSGSGQGRHLLYTAPDDFRPSGALAPGIDLKFRGYILAEPSIHPSGGVYRWADGASPGEIDLAPAPSWLANGRQKQATTGGLSEYAKAAIDALELGYLPSPEGTPYGTHREYAVAVARYLEKNNVPAEAARATLSGILLRSESQLGVDPWERSDVDEIVRSVFADASADGRVQMLLKQYRAQEQARELLRLEKINDRTRFSPPLPGLTLADDLAEPREDEQMAIERLLPMGGNALLVAERKAGKTTLLLNLLQAFADDDFFLDEFKVEDGDGKIAFWNYEVSANQFRAWVDDIGVEHPERVLAPFHLRGRTFPLFTDDTLRSEVAAQYREAGVTWLIMDPAQRATLGIVENSNDNDQVARFTDLLDQFKQEAGIRNLVLATHTGKAVVEDAEHARAATRWEDWADALWYLTQAHGRRALRAIGRDVELEAHDLDYTLSTRHFSFTGETRNEHRDKEKTKEGLVRVVKALVALNDAGERPTTNTLAKAIDGTNKDKADWIKEARSRGYVTTENGANRSLLHDVTDKGRDLAVGKVLDFR